MPAAAGVCRPRRPVRSGGTELQAAPPRPPGWSVQLLRANETCAPARCPAWWLGPPLPPQACTGRRRRRGPGPARATACPRMCLLAASGRRSRRPLRLLAVGAPVPPEPDSSAVSPPPRSRRAALSRGCPGLTEHSPAQAAALRVGGRDSVTRSRARRPSDDHTAVPPPPAHPAGALRRAGPLAGPPAAGRALIIRAPGRWHPSRSPSRATALLGSRGLRAKVENFK